MFKSGRLETKFLSLYKTWSCCLLDSNSLSYKWDLIAFLLSRVQLFSLFTCLSRGLFIPFLSFYAKRADWKNYPKAGRYEIVTNSQLVSQTYIFPEFSPFQMVLRGNSGIVPETLVKLEIKRFLFKGSWLVREVWCHNDAKWCDLPSFLLAREVMTQ